MNKRLEQFLSAENISQAQFADTIEVARASVSHVLAGRNKPGYDFIKSISDHYPKLSLEWLINGKGKMYKESAEIPVQKSYSDDLFGQMEEENTPTQDNERSNIAPTTESKNIDKVMEYPNNHRSISKVVIFFDDNTYQELV